jgi:hypothetical protein
MSAFRILVADECRASERQLRLVGYEKRARPPWGEVWPESCAFLHGR